MNEYVYTLLIYVFAILLLLVFFIKNIVGLKKQEKLLKNDKS